MNALDFNIEVVSRFLSDNNIPIKTVSQEVFIKQMNELGYWQQWVDFVDMVNQDFFGDHQKFLDYYYDIREKMINALKNEHYEKFNTCDMSIFNPRHIDFNNVSKSVWNHMNDNGYFISVDLKKANFQALRYVDPEIVLNCNSWDEFCRKFTDCEYIINSKYIRQVVFGQLNPARHTTVEKHMMRMVYEYIKENGVVGGLVKSKIISLCTVCVDEIIFKTDKNMAETFVKSGMDKNIENAVMRDLGFDVRISVFKAEEYHLIAKNSEKSNGKDICTFYLKRSLQDERTDFMCIPQTYNAIVYKLSYGKPVDEYDRHFVYEGIDCILNESFHIADTDKNIVPKILNI